MRITIQDIIALRPCYPPTKFLPEDWVGDIKDILGMDGVPAKDRLWVAIRPKFLSDRALQEYAVACARMVEYLSSDMRVQDCNEVAESYMDGIATIQQLQHAKDAADVANATGTAHAINATVYAAYAAVYAAYAAADAVYATSTAHAINAAHAAGRSEMQESQCSMLLHILEYLGE